MIYTITKHNRAGFIVGGLTLFLVLTLLLASLTPSTARAHAPDLYSVSRDDANLRTINPLTGGTTNTVANIPLDELELRTLNVPNFSNGLLVQHVASGSLAAKLGIKASIVPVTLNKRKILIGGDVVVKMGGENLYFTPKGLRRIRVYLGSINAGELIELTVYRNGKLITLTTVKP